MIRRPAGPTLEDVLLRALAEGRVRRPGRWPACPVCAAAMWSVERDRGRIELHCSECGALLADEEEPPTSLRLVA
ncbi:MAG TPA: hypothetical protein VE777_14840 [Gaiellales bacterium]|nr:hypothetical protein [Gaiellales bacterium]